MNASTRFFILLLLSGVVASCGGTTEVPGSPPVQISSTYLSVQSLEMLAAEVRAANGWVFHGTIQGAPEMIAPERGQVSQDLWIEYPMAQVAVSVNDPMGSMAPSSMTLRGRRGGVRIVDAQGAAANFTTSEDPSLPWREIPSTGEYVFFAIPRPQGEILLRWRAEIHNGLVSGQGTQSATDLPLAALSLPQGN